MNVVFLYQKPMLADDDEIKQINFGYMKNWNFICIMETTQQNILTFNKLAIWNAGKSINDKIFCLAIFNGNLMNIVLCNFVAKRFY